MRISVSCRSCSNEFSASEKAAGKRVKCPVCGEGVRVPEADDDDEPVAPRRAAGSRKTKGRSAASSGSSSLLIGLAAGGGGVAVLGLVFFLMNNRGGNTPAPSANPMPNVAATSPAMPGTTSPSPHMAMYAPSTAAPNSTATPTGNLAAASKPPAAASVVPASTPAQEPTVGTTGPATKEAAPAAEETPRRLMEMPELVKFVERSVVRIIVKSEQGASVGSGFVIDTDGSIMTNYHVIEGAVSAEVEFETGKKLEVIGFTTIDKERDLAIIKIKQDPAELFKVRVAGQLPEKGQKVAAFGAPRGLSFTASDGIISAIRPTPEFTARTAGTYLQTTTPISPGNSGGPLVNMFGEVVGVNSFKIEGENLNFAASATDIREVIASRGTEVTPLSPSALERVFTKKNPFARAENLAGTTKGNILLGRISEAFIMMLPFAVDPSGNITNFVSREISKNLITKAKWTEAVPVRGVINKKAAVVVVLIYFTADQKNPNAVELMCNIQIVARDVDKDGLDYTAIVYDENKSLGKISMNSLVNGNIPNGMKEEIPKFFNKIVQDFRKAQRNNANQ